MYQSYRHYSLSEQEWDPQRVSDIVDRIGQRTVKQWADHGAWWPHPLDDFNAPPGLYIGASGVVWALDALQRGGAAVPPFDARSVLLAELDSVREAGGKLPYSDNEPWLIGGTAPIHMLLYRLSEDPAHADAVHEALSRNTEQPCRELMWGMAGSMIAAAHMHRLTGEARWGALFRAQAEKLLADARDSGPGLLWDIDLYRTVSPMLGLVHGFGGNISALAVGQDLLTPEMWGRVVEGACATALETAEVSEGKANWPSVAGKECQKAYICHGAPGMIIALGGLPSRTELDTLLLQAGQLVWEAGAVRIGPSLCHGTAGNGYALLKLFERSGDPLWLERARAFAMEACAQLERTDALFQMPRCTLWTGDLGVALFLQACLNGAGAFPTVEHSP